MNKTNLDYCTIKASCKGVIISRRVNVGQTVVSSTGESSLFLFAKDLQRMQILAQVNEADIGRIHAGLPVTFTIDTYRGEVFKGMVEQVRLNAQEHAERGDLCRGGEHRQSARAGVPQRQGAALYHGECEVRGRTAPGRAGRAQRGVRWKPRTCPDGARMPGRNEGRMRRTTTTSKRMPPGANPWRGEPGPAPCGRAGGPTGASPTTRPARTRRKVCLRKTVQRRRNRPMPRSRRNSTTSMACSGSATASPSAPSRFASASATGR